MVRVGQKVTTLISGAHIVLDHKTIVELYENTGYMHSVQALYEFR